MFIHPTKLNPKNCELKILRELAWRKEMLLCPPTLNKLSDKIGEKREMVGSILASMDIKGFVEHDGTYERNTKITPRGLSFV